MALCGPITNSWQDRSIPRFPWLLQAMCSAAVPRRIRCPCLHFKHEINLGLEVPVGVDICSTAHEQSCESSSEFPSSTGDIFSIRHI